MDAIPSSPSQLPSSQQSTSSTPTKRKRNIPTSPATSPSLSTPSIRLNTSIPTALVINPEEAEAQNSPRTKVAYNFQGLQLGDGSAVSKLEFHRPSAPLPRDESTMEENAIRKKMKVYEKQSIVPSGRIMSDGTREVPETPDKRAFNIIIGPRRTADQSLNEKAKPVHNEVDPMIFKGNTAGKLKAGAGLARAYPSINRLSDSKSRASSKPKKRAGTPPLFGSADTSLENEGEARIVDEERAAMTWHDDEITGHDPDDPDDDGEGINGIGFKPTPAIAYARTEKRRQQMQEYKNREAREARAKRSERRKANEGLQLSTEDETARRVRFSEGEKDLISMI